MSTGTLLPATGGKASDPLTVPRAPGVTEWVCFPLSWALLTFGIVTILSGSAEALANGGYCATGGPYPVATECSPGVKRAVLFALITLALGTLLGLLGSRGFGAPAHFYTWTAIFMSQSATCLIAAFDPTQGSTGGWIVSGLTFLALAVLPMPAIVNAGARSVIGQRRLDGRIITTFGLPGRDGVIITAVWGAAILFGFLFALLLEQHP